MSTKIMQTRGPSGPVIQQQVTPMRVGTKDVQGLNFMPGVQSLARSVAQGADRKSRETLQQKRLEQENKLAQQRMAQARSLQAQRIAAQTARDEAQYGRQLRLDEARRGAEMAQREQLFEQKKRLENMYSPIAEIDDEALKKMGLSDAQIAYVRKNPAMFESVRKARQKQADSIALEQSRQEGRERILQQREAAKQTKADTETKKAASGMIANFEAFGKELSGLSRSAIANTIGVKGEQGWLQRGWQYMMGGGPNNEARVLINQYLGNLESDLMATVKGNPSDRDVAIALSLIRAAREAEQPEVFVQAIRRAQNILGRKAGLEPGKDFKEFMPGGLAGDKPEKRSASDLKDGDVVMQNGRKFVKRGQEFVPLLSR